jgi:hypothetical protein
VSAGACGSWATSCATELLVVDRERALVGSANLTHRARQHNLEAGVLIADPDVRTPSTRTSGR